MNPPTLNFLTRMVAAHPRQLPPGITIMPRSHATSVQPGLSAEMDCNTVVSQVSPWTTPASPNGAIPLRNEANQQTQPLTVGSTAEVAKISPLLACNFDDSLSPERFMRSWREGNVRNLPWIQFMSSISALFCKYICATMNSFEQVLTLFSRS